MEASTTFRIFVDKTLKEKKFFWARNLFFTLFPLLFFILYFVFAGFDDKVNSSHINSYEHGERILQEVTP
jgi:hypothetical protein